MSSDMRRHTAYHGGRLQRSSRAYGTVSVSQVAPDRQKYWIAFQVPLQRYPTPKKFLDLAYAYKIALDGTSQFSRHPAHRVGAAKVDQPSAAGDAVD